VSRDSTVFLAAFNAKKHLTGLIILSFFIRCVQCGVSILAYLVICITNIPVE